MEKLLLRLKQTIREGHMQRYSHSPLPCSYVEGFSLYSKKQSHKVVPVTLEDRQEDMRNRHCQKPGHKMWLNRALRVHRNPSTFVTPIVSISWAKFKSWTPNCTEGKDNTMTKHM